MKKNSKKKIALIFNHDIGYCRDVLHGIQEFHLERENWIFRDGPSDKKILKPLKEWQPDGIIAHVFDEELALELNNLNIPIINTTQTVPNSPLPVIDVDNEEVGRLAANYIMQKQFTDYGYFGSDWAQFSVLRHKGYAELLKKNNRGLKFCNVNFLPRLPVDESWVNYDQSIKEWILNLEKPAAIFASNDTPAKYLAEVCQQIGVKIPDDVAILGVDNNLMECTLSTPPISSIEIPAKKIGYKAAELLEKVMNGKKIPQQTFLSPSGIIPRRSTDILAVEDKDVAIALSFIRNNLHRRVLIDEICEKVGVSRRHLERKFRRDTGKSIHNEIRDSQIELAKNILRENKKTIVEVAELCGSNSTRSFSTVFKSCTGMTPSEYRDKH